MFKNPHKIKFFFFSNILIALLCLAACSAKPLLPLDSTDSILAFGDSLTAGYGASKETAYPAVLERLSGLNVINAGISGETTHQGLKRFADTLDKHSPSLVILLEGGNDILQNQNLNETKSNLAAMIEIAQTQEIPVLLIGVPEKNLFSSAAPLYQELADQYNLVFSKDLMASLLKAPDLKSDTVHLNEAGYAKMAKEIFTILEDNGAL